ncbi:permease [Saccharibacillus alkalitolerans]|uniref:Permease n=1 Tax=Saccharibacillus alkalitolerans TaxID=2705290 RepID=A0ABX0F2G5_9BACL|nr:permease [Saccharibacillus alkalitolerans]NGZ75188.1 permease [Saccharibacillus alkalitolerans]
MSAASSASGSHSQRNKAILLAAVFILIAAAGLFYVKWWPYYHKAFKAAADHSIGSSILGEGGQAAPSWAAAWDYAVVYFKAVWKAAVLGILLGSLVQVLLPAQWLLKTLGKTSFGSTLAGGAAGLPGMMCSCCAAPIAVGLRKKQASVGASLAFWMGNPTLNPATLIFMGFVLSWKFVALRIVFGILLVFGVSYWANRFAPEAKLPEEMQPEPEGTLTTASAAPEQPLLLRWIKSVGSMALTLVPAYFIFVLLLGAARVWLFPAGGIEGGNQLLLIAGFAIAGMLFVIPTAAEIPIVQSFMALGLAGGPAAALMFTLPAVSLPSLLMVSRSFPKKVLLFVAGSVVVLGALCGLAGMLIL